MPRFTALYEPVDLELQTLIEEIQGEANRMKKNYERPAIIHTEKLEARAVTCAKADDGGCPGGPLQS